MSDIEAVKDTVAGEDQGLPDLGGGHARKKPPVLAIAIGVALFVAIGVVVQFGISSAGLFQSEPVAVTEPPLPVVPGDDIDAFHVTMNKPELRAEPDVETPVPVDTSSFNSVPDNSDTIQHLTDSMLVLIETVSATKSDLIGLRQDVARIRQEQTSILSAIQSDHDRRNRTEEGIMTGLRQNERWLGGISNQLNEIGLNVKEAAQEFPIVIYSKNVWGDDVFLTVAQKASPDQTSFLRIGGVVGRWRLVEIHGDTAIFEHFEGMKREVSL